MGGFFGTNVGAFPRLLGTEGWRLAFHFVATVSIITSGFVYRFALDPRRKVRLALSRQSAAGKQGSTLAGALVSPSWALLRGSPLACRHSCVPVRGRRIALLPVCGV